AEEHVKRSTQLANLGNRHAAAGDFKKAVIFYTDAIKYNPREYKLFGNRSFCFERMRLYMKALDDAELSLGLKPGWDKGLFRKGKALAGLKRYEEAERAFGMVVEADGSRADVAEELRRVQIAQLSDYGYTPEQSARALEFHASVKKALCFLSGANRRAGESSPWELYPVWVGNLFGSVSERQLEQLFSKAGSVDSVRLLTAKRCAFINFTRQEDGEKAIQQFHGCELNGNRLVVRYPDR
uniref:RRM domain-containing protein n=1 Tax=Tetraodon nigroviridis TaxID=99883 RepID=H3C2T1_TETNG